MVERSLTPIMIGITGKRNLLGKDDEVEATLQACFDLLDRELSASKKLFMSGLAVGADTIGARLAQKHGWQVVGVLPFSVNLFLQDFDGDGAEQLLAFVDPIEGSLADPNAGKLLVLDPLLNPQTKKPFEPIDLSRLSLNSGFIRADHHEQVGLFIAERCSLLIGVMPASEQPDRVGGTARILDFRLRGTPDLTSERIIQNSGVLRKPILLDSPQDGPAWLVDLDAVGKAQSSPLSAVQCWYRKNGAPETKVVKIPNKQDYDLVHPLHLAKRINSFNELAKSIDDETWRKDVAARARRDEQWQVEAQAYERHTPPNASSSLRHIRLALSVIQGSKKQALTFTIKLLAVLFVLAIVALEVHLQFEIIIPLVFYVALLVLITLVFVLARERALQQYTEDYRAVAEAVRVQLAWWDAGLSTPDFRVDQFYLRGAYGSLALVRAAVRHLIDAALLSYPPPTRAATEVRSWVDGQVKYFNSRTVQRRTSLGRFEDIIWFMFFGSLGMASTLLPIVMSIKGMDSLMNWIDAVLRPLRGGMFGWIVPILALLIVWLLFRLARFLSKISKKKHAIFGRLTLDSLNWLIALLAGGIFSVISIYGFVFPPFNLVGKLVEWEVMGFAGDTCKTATALCARTVAHNLVATITIIVVSIAGALRFYVERLTFSAELHSYREALGTYQRAQAELRKLETSESESTRTLGSQVLFELGQYALRENESWIRSHRVRPLEPHF
jgi:hypothetical protein